MEKQYKDSNAPVPSGSQYNATGDLEDWWNPNTFEEYKKRARCFTHAYANYSETIQNITIKVIKWNFCCWLIDKRTIIIAWNI